MPQHVAIWCRKEEKLLKLAAKLSDALKRRLQAEIEIINNTPKGEHDDTYPKSVINRADTFLVIIDRDFLIHHNDASTHLQEVIKFAQIKSVDVIPVSLKNSPSLRNIEPNIIYEPLRKRPFELDDSLLESDDKKKKKEFQKECDQLARRIRHDNPLIRPLITSILVAVLLGALYLVGNAALDGLLQEAIERAIQRFASATTTEQTVEPQPIASPTLTVVIVQATASEAPANIASNSTPVTSVASEATELPTPSFTSTPTPTATPTATNTPTLTTPAPTATPSFTSTNTPTPTPTPTVTPSPTPTPTVTPSPTPTATNTPTPTASPTSTACAEQAQCFRVMLSPLITHEQYRRCTDSRGCNQNQFTFGDLRYDPEPVIGVTWLMAQQYCISQGGRLPTAAEWEALAQDTQAAAVREWTATSEEGINYSPYGPADGYVSMSEIPVDASMMIRDVRSRTLLVYEDSDNANRETGFRCAVPGEN